MEVETLKQLCKETVARSQGGAVMLVLKGAATAEARRLCDSRGPRGEVICVNRDGNTVCRFSAASVLKFIEREEREQKT